MTLQSTEKTAEEMTGWVAQRLVFTFDDQGTVLGALDLVKGLFGDVFDCFVSVATTKVNLWSGVVVDWSCRALLDRQDPSE